MAAAATSVALVVVFGLYMYGVIVCGFMPPVAEPEITAGTAHFDRPAGIVISVTRDRQVYLAWGAVPKDQVASELRKLHAQDPNRPIELRADRSLTLSELAPVLRAMQDAGYTEFAVFGRPSTVLQLAARSAGT